MRILTDRQRHVALELRRGPQWVSFITLSASGPQLQRDRCGHFDGVFTNSLDLSVEVAAARMLKGKAFNPDPRAVDILKEIIMSNTKVTELKLADIVAEYNLLAESLGKPTVKKFANRAAGEERLSALRKEVAKATKAAAKPKAEKAAKPKAEKADGERKTKPMTERKIPETGIGAHIVAQLRKGQGADEILSGIAKKFPDSRTTKHSVAFYRSMLRTHGELRD